MYASRLIIESNMLCGLSRVSRTWQWRRWKIDDRFHAIHDILEKNHARVWRAQTVSYRGAAIKMSSRELSLRFGCTKYTERDASDRDSDRDANENKYDREASSLKHYDLNRRDKRIQWRWPIILDVIAWIFSVNCKKITNRDFVWLLYFLCDSVFSLLLMWDRFYYVRLSNLLL